MTRSEVQDPHGSGEPSAWVVEYGRLIPNITQENRGNILDLACGKGRHTRHFLALEYRVTAVDRNISGLDDIASTQDLEIIEADLEAEGAVWPLEGRVFAGVVVTNYLWRPILPHIVAAVAHGGVLIYETFAQGNEQFGRPRNPDHLLRPGELKATVDGELDVIAYEHKEVSTPRPAMIQRICARRPV